MFPQEAAWIAATLAALPSERLAPVLDVGAADLAFRSVEQPWIERDVFAPLRQRRIPIVFADVKQSPGVDVVADLGTADGARRLQAVGAGTVLCCNVLEHVPDAADFAQRLTDLVRPGARLVVTVPHRYPYHRDPIDTMLRPNVQELAALFPNCDVEKAAIVRTGSYRDEFRRRPFTLLCRHLFRLPVPFLGWQAWLRSVRKLQYLVGFFEVTCVCLVKR